MMITAILLYADLRVVPSVNCTIFQLLNHMPEESNDVHIRYLDFKNNKAQVDRWLDGLIDMKGALYL